MRHCENSRFDRFPVIISLLHLLMKTQFFPPTLARCCATFFCGAALLWVAQQSPKAQSVTVPGTTQTPVAVAPRPTPPPATAKDLIGKGVQLYRTGKYDQALKQFLSALKLEPINDEALGYASLTSYQLGSQAQARDLFQKRADLPNQKPSVKLFCTYMTALTRWRQAREIIAKHGAISGGKTVYKLVDKDLIAANEQITAGLTSINKVLEMKSDYAEALNIKNLLHAEAAAIATDESKAQEHRKESLQALRQALKLHKSGADDFGAPTLRVDEFSQTDEEQAQLTDSMWAIVEGGRPLTRAGAVLPIIKIKPKAKPTTDSENTGVGATGGAVSVGPGRGALRSDSTKPEILQLKGGLAKVEVLIAPTGSVVFARIVDGPAATTTPALAAAKKWTFTPPKFEGLPVQVSGVVTFNVKSAGKNPADNKKATPPAKPTGSEQKKN